MEPEELSAYNAFLKASEQEDNAIGEAFRNHLTLNDSGVDVPIIVNMQRVSREICDRLLQEPSVKAGGQVAELLAHFGITPVIIAEAITGIANLARRYCVHHQTNVLLIADESDDGLSYHHSIREIMLVTGLPLNTAFALFLWLLDRVKTHRRMFNGFTVISFDDAGLVLERSEILDDMTECWSLTA